MTHRGPRIMDLQHLILLNLRIQGFLRLQIEQTVGLRDASGATARNTFAEIVQSLRLLWLLR